MNQRKMIKINEGFVCENCGFIVPKASKTCRNHCPQCLFSKHVDEKFPGDRQSRCLSLMEPIHVELKSSDTTIVQKCLKCGKIVRNKVASDDNKELIVHLSAQ